MSHAGRIVVTTGPERGKVFELEEELVHIGRAPENQVVLEDPALEDHQATILFKNGRCAIFRPAEADVEVDGSDIPIGQWVWLPIQARLQFGRRTTCQFSHESPGETVLSESDQDNLTGNQSPQTQGGGEDRRQNSDARPAPALPGESVPAREEELEAASTSSADSRNGRTRGRSGDRKTVEKKKKKKRKKQIARFITDQGGPMVELGADGHLPELALQDGPSRKLKRTKQKSSSPALLYCVLGLSMLASLSLLLVDASPTTAVAEISRSKARQELVRFFGMPEDVIAQRVHEMKQDRQQRWMWPSNNRPVPLMGHDQGPAPWQKALRTARIAHSRGDRKKEYEAYRQVLDQLNAEDHDLHFGLTGHADGDEELKRLVSIVISR